MKTLRMTLLLFAFALMQASNAQDVQTEQKTFSASQNIRFAGMEIMKNGTIYMATSLQAPEYEHEGSAIYKMYPNGAQIGKVDVELDHIEDFIVTPDGSFILLFNFGMFEDIKSVTNDFRNSQDYYYPDRDPVEMPGVLKMSPYGSLVWIKELKPAQYFNDMDDRSMLRAPDGTCWILFNYSEDDPESEFGGMLDFSRLVVLDSNGTILTEKTFSEREYGLLKAPILQPDGRLMVFADRANSSVLNTICIMDKQGNFIEKRPVAEIDSLPADQVYPAAGLGFVLAKNINSQKGIWLVDQKGKPSWKQTLEGDLWSIAASDEEIFAVTADRMAFPDGNSTPVSYTITRIMRDGTLGSSVMTFTHNGAIWIKKTIATGFGGVVIAGDTKTGEIDDVSLIITIPLENSDIFKNINTYDFREYTKAVENNDFERVKALAGFGISPNFKYGNKIDDPEKIDYPVLLAISGYKYNMAELMMLTGADPNNAESIRFHYNLVDELSIEHLRVTPLMYIAVNPGFQEMERYVDLLAKNNADFKAASGDGSVFGLALGTENTAFMDLYAKYAPLDDFEKRMYMKKAIETKRAKSLEWLLNNGADPYYIDYDGLMIMDYGLKSDSKEVKAVLKEYSKTHKK